MPCGRFLVDGTSVLSALQIEQEFLPPESTAVTAELAVLFNDTVTRNYDRDSVVAVCSSYRTLCTGSTNFASLLLVTDSLTIRNTLKTFPWEPPTSLP